MAKSWQCVAWASAAFATCVLIVGACFLLLRLAPGAPEDQPAPNCLRDPGSFSRRDIDASEFADDLVKSFRIKCRVKFFDMCAKYPNIITGRVSVDYASATNIVFTSHGLGPAYPADHQGKMTFYCQTAAEVGPRGRGLPGQRLDDGGWHEGMLIPGKRLDDGEWHEIELVKGSTSASVFLDVETVYTANILAGLSAADFVLRPIDMIFIGGQGFNGDIRNVEIYVGDPERLVFSSACNGTALPVASPCGPLFLCFLFSGFPL